MKRSVRRSAGGPGSNIALAEIRRREWLLQVLALAAAGCMRRLTDRDSTLTITYPLSQWNGLFTDSESQFLVFLPLVTRKADGKLEGRLAERWEATSDYRSWTVHLRRDVRWHDGVPVTAHDVKFTLDLIGSPQPWIAAPEQYSVTVLDDYSYTITYDPETNARPGSPLDDYTVYYPKHLLEDLDPVSFAEWDFWSHPVGNGPYRYVRQQPHTMMEFEANPDYYRGKPRIERVVLKFADAVTSPELLSGNVDAIVYADRLEVLNLLKDARFEAYHAISPNHNRAIAWNHRGEFFRDPGVRRALTLAIDRAELHRVMSFPEQLPIFDSPFTWYQLQHGEIPAPIPYDPEQARHLLNRAGWQVSEAGSVRARGGTPFRFTMLTPALRRAEAVYIQNKLRQIGVEVAVQTMEFIAMRERVEEGRFDAALHVVNARLASPIGLVRFFGEESLIGYSNPVLIGLLSELQTASDPDEIERIHREFVPIFQKDIPVTYLYPVVSTTVTSRRVRGLSTPYRADIVSHVDELWLDNTRR